jgi:hypothetical protein
MNPLLKILTADLSPMRFVIAWLAYILAFGFFASSTNNHNYEFINTVTGKNIWGSLFVFHGTMMMVTALFTINNYTRSAVSIIGIFLWSYVFLSFTFYDPTPINSTEWMLMIPVILECWFLAETPKRGQ